jgi:hypothetical protein
MDVPFDYKQTLSFAIDRCRGDKRPAQWRIEGRSLPPSPQALAVRRKISNDGASEERRGTRLKGCSLPRDKNESAATEMLHRSASEEHRDLRRVRQERSRREMDYGTNRAIIVGVVGGMLSRTGVFGVCYRCGSRRRGASFQMNVSKRNDELQR